MNIKYNPKKKITVEITFTDGKKECLKDVNRIVTFYGPHERIVEFLDVNNNLIIFPIYNIKWIIIKK